MAKLLAAHALLRSATADVHARLHLHPGFAALAAGEIGLDDYRLLLERLYGFHRMFEAASGLPALRSRRIADDLRALGASEDALTALPMCGFVPAPTSPAAVLGSRYVVEGAGLGGQVLARALDRLLSAHVGDPRSFFRGEGSATGAGWRGFLGELDAGASGPAERDEAVAGALAVFAAFETWLAGWRQGAGEGGHLSD